MKNNYWEIHIRLDAKVLGLILKIDYQPLTIFKNGK